MDKRALQLYAVWAKNNLESQIEVSLKTLGINSEKDIKAARKVGDYTIIDGDSNSYPGDLKDKRDSIVKLVKTDGYKQVIEEFAYTWFNRIVALRFMEVHDFLPHGFRVLSSHDGGVEPEIMKHLDLVKDELKLDLSVVQPLYAQGKLDEAYSYVLFRQCNALSGILPMLFDRDQDYLELLLPKALLKGETFITKLMEIGEDDFLNDVEVIGWLYQFYISQKKDEVSASKKTITKDTLPAVTQLFTPDWIVRYMAENSVGRIWLESYPNSPLKSEMKYYVEDAKQDAEVQQKLNSIKYKNINPEEIKVIEPCCGSGHILVYVFDLLYKFYEERGYQSREIPSLILKNNLVGLDVDKRASQLASFSLVMKARSKNSRFFSSNYYIEPKVYEIWDSRELLQNGYEQQLAELGFLSNEEIKEIKWLVEEFRYAKTIGSLLKINKKSFDLIENALNKIREKAVFNIFNTRFLNDGMNVLTRLLSQAKIMARKYDVLITNPPYRLVSTMEDSFKNYASKEYPNSKTDMCAMFMETNFVKNDGFLSMINMHSWMFLNSYDKLRENFINRDTFLTLIHLGAHAFETIGGEVVQTCAFVARNEKIDLYKGRYYRLLNSSDKEKDFLNGLNRPFEIEANKFKKYPTCQIVYWSSKNIDEIFNSYKKISDYATPKSGIMTGKDPIFIRNWYEVSLNKLSLHNNSLDSFKSSKNKWFPLTRGGEFRKWYGNLESVINMMNEGYDISHYPNNNYRLRDRNYYFQEALTWTMISGNSLSIRYVPKDILFGNGGPTLFAKDNNYYFMGLLNSVVANHFTKMLNPTINTIIDDIVNIPVIIDDKERIEKLVKSCVAISKENWDLFETSWDFSRHPLIGSGYISTKATDLILDIKSKFELLKKNEIEINDIFIKMYGLESQLNPYVDDSEVSIFIPTIKDLIKSLISYLIGIEMGRYSLDVEGLAYAGGEWNPMNYVTYQPDDDGIIPVYTQLGMSDGLTARIIRLIKHIYGEDTYRENIEFIAEALGKNQNESAEETLNRYLFNGFYSDHLQTYRSRTTGAKPIYWMFSSGKNDAFKCLVYLHRYNEDTLAKINSKYFLNESARLNVEVNETRTLLEAADGREKLRLDKQMKLLNSRQKEMIEYGQVLDHMANQYINLDLDDGVKVNYAKFQGIEIVNDNGAKVKKDLLVPIK